MDHLRKKAKTCCMLIGLLVITICVCMGFMPTNKANAASGSCDGVPCNNVDFNDYSTYGSVVTSYLHLCNDGRIMRVQKLKDESGHNQEILIQYYDSNYNFKSFKRITCELPIFGGFHAMDNGYYILSGQNNPDQDNSVEVYRITKYDLNWNRISSVGLYGANTYIPFDAGSARFDSKDNYLAIRTCHVMYASSDGLHHQANVTIMVNTQTMEITDSFFDVANASWAGYCSHSFNQFVKLDGIQLVGVDHGDAEPRAITISKSPYATYGEFSYSSYYKEMLHISGKDGDNYTGASLGGFEISESHYIVVGNTEDQQSTDRSEVRNVFLSVIDRDWAKDYQHYEGKVVTRYLTDYPSGSEYSAKTPVLVKINDNRFLVLWGVHYGALLKDWTRWKRTINADGNSLDTIHYVEIDGQGNAVGSLHTMKGYLSDCQPIVVNDKIIWYTINYDKLIFYEISTNDISDTSSIEIKEGHVIPSSTVAGIRDEGDGGLVSCLCERCGKHVSYIVPNSFDTAWGKDKQKVLYSPDYSNYIDTNVSVGDTVYVKLCPDGEFNLFILAYEISDPTKCSFDKCEDMGGDVISFAMLKPGTVTISVWPKYNPYNKITKTFTVTGTVPIETVIKKHPLSVSVEEGKTAYFDVEAIGEGLKYLWQYKYAGSDTWVDWTSKNTASISVAYADYRNGMRLRCIVTDSSGKKKTSDEAVLNYKKEEKLAITGQPVSTSVENGKLAYFEVKATGKGLKYLWQYKEKGKSSWTDWTSKTTANISVAYAAYRDGMSFRCKVTDANGANIISDEAVLTYKSALSITKQPANATADTGSVASFSVTATGTGLKYLWQYKNAGDSSWTDWTSKTTASISVAYAAYRDGMSLRCVVTDSTGKQMTSNVATLTYNKTLAITKQPSSTSVNENELAYFEVTATGKGLKYLWQYKEAGKSTWTDWTSKTTAKISVAYASYRDRMSFRCVITDSTGAKLTSSTVTLTYNKTLKITKQPSNTTVNEKELAYFEVTATGKGLKYLWQYKEAGKSTWTDWTSKTTAKISVAYAASRNGLSLRCVVTDSTGAKVTSDTVTLTYTAPFAITKQPANASVDKNTLANFSVKATGKGLKYQWQYKLAGDSDWTTWSSKTTADITVAYAAYRNGMSLRCVILDASGNKINSNVVTLSYK